MTKFAAITAI